MKDFDETRDRFLAAVAGSVPIDKVVEVHLFQPIRQGGMQSGVAVVAVEEEGVPNRSEAAAEHQTEERSASAAHRLAVYTARYLLTQKGPDRGKWDYAIQVEADAPLVTVDKVVRGVQRRSGDAEDPQRLTGEEFRAMVVGPRT
jgi:hypothetical protein